MQFRTACLLKMSSHLMNGTATHINVLELEAVYFGLKGLCRDLKETHIKISTDNTTAVHGINNMGSCKSVSCETEVRKIWDWTIERNNFLTAAHIPGNLNVEVDAESRESETRTEWKLNDSVLSDMLKHFKFKPVIDLFVSRINNQLPRFPT